MALVLNTNIASMNAQRNLSNTQAQQATTFQRLSTGLRVNSAKDDAAGLYLAQSQTKDIRGLNMATRNASDGISMAQTAEGALDQIAQNLQRVNELAIQSANGTYNDQAREGLQKEVDELTQEINRIVETTEFNGKKLLNPEAESTIMQIGFRDDQGSQIATGLEGGLVAQGNLNKFTFQGAEQTFATEQQANAAGKLALTRSLLKEGQHPNEVLTPNDATTPIENIYADVTFAALGTGANATATSKDILAELEQLGNGQSVTVDGMTLTRQGINELDKVGTQLELSFNGKTTTIDNAWGDGLTAGISSGAFDPSKTITADKMEALFGKTNPSTTANSAPVSGMQPLAKEFFGGASKTTYADISLAQMKISDHLSTMKEGDKVEIDGVTYARGTGDKYHSLQVTYKSNTVEMPNVFKEAGKVGIEDPVVAGSTSPATTTGSGVEAVLTGAASGGIETLFGSASTKQNHMSDLLNRDLAATKTIDISNPDSARKAIDFTRDSIDLISEIRATFGAVMNRFEAVISGNQTYAENLSDARSRIQDADFAVETAALAKQQVLQQAGVASLSQANASSQAILSLLG